MTSPSMSSIIRRVVPAGITAALLLTGCERPPVVAVQHGYRGTAMVEVYHPATLEADAANNQPPAPSPVASPDGPKASAIYQNVKVLGDLSVGQFAGLMVDITNWVAPAQGCTYCHAGGNFADDTLYTKVVARKMLQMTQRINNDWKSHVQNVGVTCYTCHRGNNVPTNIWFRSVDAGNGRGMLGWKDGQDAPSQQVAYASLPNDPFSRYLEGAAEIRVNSVTALPEGPANASIKNAEGTYGLMMHMSTSLGVNCTYCHNTRGFASWELSTPQRNTAWYGIRMARELNVQYLDSLAGVFPDYRLGPTGDVPKLNCATCHQGAFKPLYGADILQGHPGLIAPKEVGASVLEAAPGLPALPAPAATVSDAAPVTSAPTPAPG